MPTGTVSDNAPERLEGYRGYRVISSGREKIFEQLVLITARLFDMPFAFLSLADPDFTWVGKAGSPVGFTQKERQRELCFAALLHDREGLLDQIPHDAGEALSMSIIRHLPLQFYAGQDLTTTEGKYLGTLCVLDDHPREFGPVQWDILNLLAQVVMVLTELREAATEMEVKPPSASPDSPESLWTEVEQLMLLPLMRMRITTNRLRKAETDEQRAGLWQEVKAIIKSTLLQLT
ncbi:hypothetical protein GCM10027346_40890 [Hymenobacter seoulensis]